MKYQISYCGTQGCAEKTADYIYEKLPKDTLVLDTQEDTGVFAETVIAVFEMGSNLDAVPYNIIDMIEKAKGKKLILLALLPIEANETVKSRIERDALPFIPDECEYLGIDLLRGEANEKLVRGIKNILEADPDNAGAAAWLNECDKSKGHPDKEELEKAWHFIVKYIEEPND